jgi:hypothetical protein
MHVAAMKPVSLSSADVPAELVDRERSVAAAKAAEDAAVATAAGKPVQSAEIVTKLEKLVSDMTGGGNFSQQHRSKYHIDAISSCSCAPHFQPAAQFCNYPLLSRSAAQSSCNCASLFQRAAQSCSYYLEPSPSIPAPANSLSAPLTSSLLRSRAATPPSIPASSAVIV